MEELIPIFFFMCAAGVLILRPVTKKLGLLVEVLAKERMAGLNARPASALPEAHAERIVASLERLNARMDMIDDRIGFVERLVENRSSHRLTG